MTPSDPSTVPAPLPAWERGSPAWRTQALLRAQVPLSLLLDLADPQGPDSSAVYAAEPADASWACRRAG